MRPLSLTQVYPQYIQFGEVAKPNPKIIRECLILDGKVDKKAFVKIVQDCHKITKEEPNLVLREGKIAIIGDIHGQFFDMMSMLDNLTPRLDTEKDFGLLFLGDYVDRGIQCIEVLVYLMALKTLYPKQITLLRGNHESRSMTTYFTFRQECLEKYD
jgi:serine/threonine-protein phosphatase 2B catalytic subunit